MNYENSELEAAIKRVDDKLTLLSTMLDDIVEEENHQIRRETNEYGSKPSERSKSEQPSNKSA